jgi:parallel beta-helix repeat protein
MPSNLKKTKATIIPSLVFVFVLVFLAEISIAKPENIIYIRADGTVKPATAPIQRDRSIYRFTGDINGSIAVERDNMILDGNGHSLTNKEGMVALNLTRVRNVTIKNLTLKDCYGMGISLDRCSNVTVSCNTITGTSVFYPPAQATSGIYVWAGNSNIIEGNLLADNYVGVYLGYEAEQNIVVNNNITSNRRGIVFCEASNNLIYHNNFINNTINVHDNAANSPSYSRSVNSWDNGYPSGGNYWSNYTGADNNEDCIGDTLHIIDKNNQDNYPLVNVIPEFPTCTILPILITATLLTIIYEQKLPKKPSQQSY